MFKLLAFLLILVILFGIETTRALFFGTLSVLFWGLLIIVGIGVLIDALKDGRTPEEIKKAKEEEREANKAAMKANKSALLFWLKTIVIIALATTAVSVIIIAIVKK